MLYAYDKHSNGRIMHKFSYQLSNDLSLEKNNKKDNKFGLLDRNIPDRNAQQFRLLFRCLVPLLLYWSCEQLLRTITFLVSRNKENVEMKCNFIMRTSSVLYVYDKPEKKEKRKCIKLHY